MVSVQASNPYKRVPRREKRKEMLKKEFLNNKEPDKPIKGYG